MPGTTFGDRLAYLIFWKHLTAGTPPGWAEIGRAVGATGEAVLGWRKRVDPPPGYTHVRGLLAYFAPVTEPWLLEGTGDPPARALYAQWRAAREADVGAGYVVTPDDATADARRKHAELRQRAAARRVAEERAERAATKRGGRKRR